jgi:hypothetical protein
MINPLRRKEFVGIHFLLLELNSYILVASQRPLLDFLDPFSDASINLFKTLSI